MRVQSVAKSLLVGFVGAGIIGFFLMMAVIPVMALMKRLSGNVAQMSVVVDPAAFMRFVGVPAAVVGFVVLFVVALMRFRRQEQSATPRH
jgi:hypothetical protein